MGAATSYHSCLFCTGLRRFDDHGSVIISLVTLTSPFSTPPALHRNYFRSSPGDEMFGMHPEFAANHWSPTCLVTPEISGLWPASRPTLGQNHNGMYHHPRLYSFLRCTSSLLCTRKEAGRPAVCMGCHSKHLCGITDLLFAAFLELFVLCVDLLMCLHT